MSDEREHDEVARRRARALGAQQVADHQQARRQRVVERVGKSTLAAPPAGPQGDRRLDEAMHKISNAASTAQAVWLPALQAQLRMGNLAGFENLYTQTKRDIASAELALNMLERAMLYDADPSERSEVEATLAVQHQTMLAQLMPVYNELKVLRVEADAAVARAAKGGPAAAPPMLATSASELDFGMVAIGEVSRPVTVTFANTSARYLAIDAVAVSAAGGSRSSALPFRLGAADTRKAHLMPGEEMDLTVYFEPTTATWPHAWLQVKASDGPVHIVRDVSLRGSTQPASARSAGAKPVDAQNRAQQASDALVAGATPSVATSADMLAAVLAAQTLTQQDTKASRQHADAILTQLLARLAALRPTAIKRLAKEGSALHVFGAAADALDEWQAQLGLGARVATPVLVRRFQLAHEPLQFVLGETQDLPTLRPLYKAAPLSALAITGGVLMGGLLAAGALPIVASEASVLSFGGRMVAQRLVAWGAANPALALATTEMVIGFAVSVDPADYTWANLCEVFSDPKSAAMFTAQMLMDIMHLRMAGHSDGAISPAPRRGAAAGGEPAAAVPTGNRGAGARPAMQPTAADESVLRQRVQKMLAVRDDILNAAPASPAKATTKPGAPGPHESAPRTGSVPPPMASDGRVRISASNIKSASARLGVTIELDDGLHDGVTVHYSKTSKGDLTVTRVRVGTQALVEDVLVHRTVIDRVEQYNGALGSLRNLRDRVLARASYNPHPRGSKAWESFEEIVKLDVMIQRRQQARFKTDVVDPHMLEAEITWLRGYRDHHAAVLGIDAPASKVPGTGSIGSPDQKWKRALCDEAEVGAMQKVDPLGKAPHQDRLPVAKPVDSKVAAKNANSGFWADENARGNSEWFSDNEHVNKVTGYQPVVFKNGYPVLDEYAKETVYLKKMLGDKRDFAPCDRELAKRMGKFKADGTPNQTWAEKYRDTTSMTWHHHQDGVRMQLVLFDLHSNIPHAGGASKARNQ